MPSVSLKNPALLVDWVQSALLFSASLAILLLLRYLTLNWLVKQTSGPGRRGRILISSLRFPSSLWSLAGALAITLKYTDLPARAAYWAAAGLVVFLVLSVCVVVSTLLVRLAETSAQERGLSIAVSGVSKALIHVFVLTIGATVLLRYFDIPIAPLLTALGVGGLALALALRDTLANFFAGIHILVEAPISIGDFIRLSAGEEGTVTDIGWRTTRVLTTTNNVIVIPNEKITSSILTNFALPNEKVVTEVLILTAFDADVDRASAIALEEAAKEENLVPDFDPLVVFDPGVTPTHLQFKLIIQVKHRLNQGLAQSNIRRRLLERFRQEGIRLPDLPARP
ncbi:MAG: mechanosensitive ion channel family protein [Bryobacterales bacterium]|nr:mechanosensitive ion channel family protein [Bryobacterales bacterium]